MQVVSLVACDDGAPGEALTQLTFVLDAPPAEGGRTAPHCVPGDVTVHSLPTESALLHAVVAAVRALDPDILIGFEVQGGSLGYLRDRCEHLRGGHEGLLAALSRTPASLPPGALRNDEYGRNHGAGIWVTGRTVLNLWRILKGELKMSSHSFEAAMMAVLRRRVPSLPRRQLGVLFAEPHTRWRVVASVAARARGVSLMCTQLDLLGRTAELARVFGIDFLSVVIRGSQYRVESMMLRLAHTQNFLALSPSKAGVAASAAPVDIALVMAPESGFYTSPVVVLDFQSLYPSQVIAYNLCYSTCLGAAPTPGAGALAGVRRKFGAAELTLPPGVVPELAERVHITPNGSMFAPPAVRPGVLPRLLSEARCRVDAARDVRMLCRVLLLSRAHLGARRFWRRASWSRRRSRRRAPRSACCSAASWRASWG